MHIVSLPPKNNTVTKLLPSTNLTTPRRLNVSKANTKGILKPVPYRRSTIDNNLTPESSITRQVVLQGKPMPLKPGLHSITGLSGN